MEVPFLLTILESMNAATPNHAIGTTSNDEEIEIEPGISIFSYQNCAVRVEEVLDSGEVDCIVLQSSNVNYVIGSSIQMPNVNAVNQCMLNTYDA